MTENQTDYDAHPDVPLDELSVWEKPGTMTTIWVVLTSSCVAAVITGFVLKAQGKMNYKPHFEDKEGLAGAIGALADNFPAFYALVGFVSFAFIVLAGQHLRKVLARREEYYDENGGEPPASPQERS